MPDPFPDAYALALRSQRWEVVAPLIHDEACVTFSNGAVHSGKAAVQRAFEANFAAIENEDYQVTEVVWRDRTEDRASYTFRFAWQGSVAGQPASGAGTGAATLIRTEGGWLLLAEALRPSPPQRMGECLRAQRRKKVARTGIEPVLPT